MLSFVVSVVFNNYRLFVISDKLLHQRRKVLQVPRAGDGAAQEGNTFAHMSVCAAHNGYGRTDGSQDCHDELNDVLDSFLFHFFLIVLIVNT